MISGQRSSAALEDRVIAQQDARAVLELMAMEIGMASYNPNFVVGIWRNPGDCLNASANQTYRGIQVATVNSITVEMDIPHTTALGVLRPESGAIALADADPDDRPNEIIAYVYDTANERITRQTNCGGAQSFLGDVAGNPRSVRVVNNTAGIPIFTYFDGMGVQIPAGNLPANIPNIRRIEITLVVDTEDVDPDTGQRRRLIYSTSVIPRNYGINIQP